MKRRSSSWKDDEERCISYTCIDSSVSGREIKRGWQARGRYYEGLTIISATWLPLYCSIHDASDVVATIRIIYCHHVYARQRVDQLANVRWYLPSTLFFLQLFGACMLFQLFEYWGIKVRSLCLDENVWLYESARISSILPTPLPCQK